MVYTSVEYPEEIKRRIVEIVAQNNPESIRSLMHLVKRETHLSDMIVLSLIEELESEKRLHFEQLSYPLSIIEYLFSFQVIWYWLIITLSLLTGFLVFRTPEQFANQIYGSSFLVVLVCAIFFAYLLNVLNLRSFVKTNLRFDKSTFAVSSLGIGVALVLLVFLVFYVQAWSLQFSFITLVILSSTLILATIQLLSEHRERNFIFLSKIHFVSKFELSKEALRFFDQRGLMKKKLIIAKEIPISSITKIDSYKNELRITSDGISHIFFIDDNAKSLQDVRDAVRGMIGKFD